MFETGGVWGLQPNLYGMVMEMVRGLKCQFKDSVDNQIFNHKSSDETDTEVLIKLLHPKGQSVAIETIKKVEIVKSKTRHYTDTAASGSSSYPLTISVILFASFVMSFI